MKFSKIFKVAFIFILISTNIGCDQVSKSVVRNTIAEYEQIQIISKHLTLTKVENTGAALGFAASFPPILKTVIIIILPCIILLIMLGIILSRNTIDKTMIIGFTFIIGGGIGNLADRILYGSVTDFMVIDLGVFKTGIFNMADLSVTIGALIILIHSFISNKQKVEIEA